MNLFELFVKIGVDDQASDKISSLSSKLSNGLKTAAKVGAAAVGVAATAISALTTQAVNSFAEYEQLSGGAKKIFDQMDYSKIANDANNAYKELGLSANQYLAVINDVGATFAATMGDEAGYKAAKTGLKAISDYASGTGKNVNELSQKFTLITRSTSSYQSIADQFSGILPATSAGFLKQAKAVGILSDKYNQLTEVPIEEYQDAVSKMLEQGVKDLGLANNTMEEAFSTLSGSLNMAKSAWDNLVTGLADDSADLDVLIGNFVESAGAVASQLIPKIETALNGAVKLVSDLFPKLAEELPGMIESLLPSVMTGITNILASVIENLPQIIDSIMDMLPGLIDTLVEAIVELAPELAEGIVEIIQSLADHLPEIIQAFIDALPLITEAVNNAIIENFPALLEGIIQIVLLIVKNLPAIIQALVDQMDEIVATIVQVLVENAPALIEGVAMIVLALIKALPEILASVGESVLNIFKGIGKGLSEAWPAFREGIVNIWIKFTSWFSKKWEEMKGIGKRIVDGLLQGIKNAWENLKKWFSDAWNGLVGGVKDFLGIHSPSRLFAGIGKNMALGVGEGWGDEFGNIRKDIDKSLAFDDAAINISASTENISSKQISPSSAGTSIGNVTINIDGAKYENEQSLASAIAEVLQNMTDRRSAIYA